jgi:hypothetical protein
MFRFAGSKQMIPAIHVTRDKYARIESGTIPEKTHSFC